jgi:hypothetical protein
MPDLFDESGIGRVRIIRDPQGRVRGYQDPDANNRFIDKETAISRLKFNPEARQIQDSFKNEMPVGQLGVRIGGVVLNKVNVAESYQSISGNIRNVVPTSHQEIIERVSVLTKDGRVETIEISYGRGQEYVEGKNGGYWRYRIATAAGISDGRRLPSTDLKNRVLNQEFLIKTVSPLAK